MLNLGLGIFFSSFLKSKWGESVILMSFFVMVLLIKGGDFCLMSSFFFLDGMSKSLGLLSLWVSLLCVLSSLYIKNFSLKSGFYLFNMWMLVLFLFFSFFLSSFFFFYFVFECSLIPIFLMIMGWGYQPERIQAGFYMFFYTLFGSFPLFCVIIYLLSAGDSVFMSISYRLDSLWVFFFIVLGFLIKFPMYGLHVWLLKAHVEAPVAGSMILAGVLLKLGGYGLIRFSIIWCDYYSFLFDFFILFSIWGGFIMSVHCFRMVDMKLLIASSSVVHMSMCIASIFYFSDWGYAGCVLMMVAHGLVSSGLFYLSNVVYSRYSSRSLFICKGLLNIMPSMCIWWFLMCSLNMAAPPSMNLWSEISLIINFLSWSWFILLPISLMSFFSAGYSLFLYSLSQHGVYVSVKLGYSCGLMLEYFISVLHVLPVNLLILSCYLIY